MFNSIEDAKLKQVEFENKLLKYSTIEYKINDLEKVIIVEDSLVLFIKIKEYKQGDFNKNWEFVYQYSIYDFYVDEITFNNIGFKCKEDYYIDYWHYHKDDIIDYVDAMLPQIQIKNRIDIWNGIKHHIIVYEIKDKDGNVKFAIAYTSRNAYEYVNNICRKYIKTGIFSGCGTLEKHFRWRTTSEKERITIVETELKYFYIEKYFTVKDDVWKYANEILELAKQNKFDKIKRYSYNHSVKKWKNEDRVLKLTSKLYKDYIVISQHRPYFLKSSFGGQMSYDVYISQLNIAIEYQGVQHFQPVEIFGGAESFEKQKIRDKEKKKLSEENGVRLIYINYDEEVTEQLIKSRINEVLSG